MATLSVDSDGYHQRIRRENRIPVDWVRRRDQFGVMARIVDQYKDPELIDGHEERGSETGHDVCNRQPRQEDVGSTPKLRSFPDRVCHEGVSCCADENH